jgi:hypothetical protein
MSHETDRLIEQRRVLLELLSAASDHLDPHDNGCECEDIGGECVHCLQKRIRIVINSAAQKATP